MPRSGSADRRRSTGSVDFLRFRAQRRPQPIRQQEDGSWSQVGTSGGWSWWSSSRWPSLLTVAAALTVALWGDDASRVRVKDVLDALLPLRRYCWGCGDLVIRGEMRDPAVAPLRDVPSAGERERRAGPAGAVGAAESRPAVGRVHRRRPRRPAGPTGQRVGRRRRAHQPVPALTQCLACPDRRCRSHALSALDPGWRWRAGSDLRSGSSPRVRTRRKPHRPERACRG